MKDARENKVFQQSMETVSWGETTKEVVQHGLEQGGGKEKHGSPNCNTQSLRKCERKRNGEFLNEEKKIKNQNCCLRKGPTFDSFKHGYCV